MKVAQLLEAQLPISLDMLRLLLKKGEPVMLMKEKNCDYCDMVFTKTP